MLTYERAAQLFEYDPVTSCVYNKVNRGRVKAGTRAGTICNQGYRQIQVDGYIYKEHRLIWLLAYGEWPSEIDHIDGDRTNNVLSNLREVSRSQNNANSERPVGVAGLRGVTWFERDQKWKAQIRVHTQTVHLGYYDTVEAAHEAYLVAADITYGEYAYHNRPERN